MASGMRKRKRQLTFRGERAVSGMRSLVGNDGFQRGKNAKISVLSTRKNVIDREAVRYCGDTMMSGLDSQSLLERATMVPMLLSQKVNHKELALAHIACAAKGQMREPEPQRHDDVCRKPTDSKRDPPKITP